MASIRMDWCGGRDSRPLSPGRPPLNPVNTSGMTNDDNNTYSFYLLRFGILCFRVKYPMFQIHRPRIGTSNIGMSLPEVVN